MNPTIKSDGLKIIPANAISGRSGEGKEDETLAAAKNSNLFLNACADY